MLLACFYYRSNIEALEHSARLEHFSPLNEQLPPVDGLYIGGGFPEAHIHELSANAALLNDVYVKAAEGMPIIAEGGGLVYLSRSLAMNDGALHKLAGVIPAEVRTTDNLQALGHSEFEIVQDCAIAGRGERLRGHEFHYSVAEPDRDARFAYKMIRGTGIHGCDGIVESNVLVRTSTYTFIPCGTDLTGLSVPRSDIRDPSSLLLPLRTNRRLL
ncbi:MAG: hypothetical protein ACLPI9_05340 [Halobacteriota archaeon]